MEIYLIIFTIIVVFIAGFTQGAIGFGSAMVAVPLLGLFIPIKTVVPFTVLNGLLITASLCWRLRREIRPEMVTPLFIGCIPGVAAGTYLLSRAPATLLQVCLGVLVISYAVYALVKHQAVRWRPSSLPAMAAGFGTGAIGAVFSAGGPPTIIYLSGLDRPAPEIKATFAGFFLLAGLLIAAFHFAAGLISGEAVRLFAFSAPAILAGVLIGEKVSRHLDEIRYRRLVLKGLFLLGLVLLMRSLG